LVVTTDKLSALAATTSAELAGVISDETGSGALVFASSPTLVTPTLGAATATSLNGVTLTGTSTPALSVTGTASVSGSNTGDQTTITGNAGTATILQTARNINGVSFNGSADITVPAAAGTLTGATLASGVTASSLTSLGTITSLTATALTVNDNTTLGSSNSDTVNFNARVASDLNPSTDDTYDLGIVGHEWRNLRVDGTANIDSLVADSADINGGTIDGTAIGATTPSTVAATTLSATGTVTSAIADKISLSGVGASDQYFLGANYTNADGTESVTTAARASWRFRMKNVATNEASIDFRAANAATNAFTAIGTFTSTGLNSTAIGATTASTGAFTTLSASGVASFAAGTNLAPAISFSADANTGFFNVAADTIGITTAGIYAGNFQTNSAGGGLYIQAGGTNQNIRLVPTGTGSVVVDIGGTITSTTSNGFDVATSGVVRGSFTSTGLAVTGALSATGNGTFSGNGATLTFSGTGSPTITATNSDLKITALAASADIIIDANRNQYQKINGSTIGLWASTGLAVTGALSSTGALAIGNTVATAVAVASTHKVTIVIGGTTYYLLATNV
jgi:hypothetical protein